MTCIRSTMSYWPTQNDRPVCSWKFVAASSASRWCSITRKTIPRGIEFMRHQSILQIGWLVENRSTASAFRNYRNRGADAPRSPVLLSPVLLHHHSFVIGLCLVASLVFLTPRARAQESPSSEVRSKIVEQAQRAFIRVELYLKAIPDEEGPGGMGETTSSQSLDQQQKQVIRFKKPIQMMGIAVSPRELFVADTGVSPQRIDHWEVTDAAGSRTTARVAAMLRDAPTLVLEPTEASVAWQPAAFADADVSATSSL